MSIPKVFLINGSCIYYENAPFEIHAARADFARDFELVRSLGGSRLRRFLGSTRLWKQMDHLEMYRSSTGRVVCIVSNYDAHPPAIFGMDPYPARLWHKNATTYIRVFSDDSHLAREIRNWKKMLKKGPNVPA